MNPQALGLVGCEEWRILKGRLELLLGQAETTGARGTSAYLRAKQYDDANSGFSSPLFMWGSACTTNVVEINSVIAGLSQAISNAGASPVISAPAIQPSAESDPFAAVSDLTKWVVGGAIAVSLAVVAATVVPRILGTKR